MKDKLIGTLLLEYFFVFSVIFIFFLFSFFIINLKYWLGAGLVGMGWNTRKYTTSFCLAISQALHILFAIGLERHLLLQC
jgi:hypothetical protein